MAYEIRPWCRNGAVLHVRTTDWSMREEYSNEINEVHGEGGGLNANYRTVEAIARIANLLGRSGMAYGLDFVWKTSDGSTISLEFLSPATKARAEEIFAAATRNTA